LTASDVLTEYETRLRQFDAASAPQHFRNLGTIVILCAALSLFFVLGSNALRRRGSFLWPVLPVPVVVLAGRTLVARRGARYRAWRLKCFYQRAIQRVDGSWIESGEQDEGLADPQHVYAADLNLFGEGSLFRLLCVARTSVGRESLAGYLLKPPSLGETRLRQDAVRELRDNFPLREKIAELGEFEFLGSRRNTFEEWLDRPGFAAPQPFPILMLASSVLLASISLWGFATHRWPHLTVAVYSLIAAHAVIGWYCRARVNQTLEAAGPLLVEMRVLCDGLALLEAEPFQSLKLRDLVEQLQGASSKMRTLERLLKEVQQRDKEWFYLPSRVLLVGTQLSTSIEMWRRKHGDALRGWLQAWGEFEALNAVGTYSYENPENVFPEFADGEACFEAKGLAHPLLPRDSCIANDVDLNRQVPFYVVSGSNMSGKSTLLRAIGLNTVLACAGAPVRATSLRMSGLSVYASISLVDSPLNGRSKFFVEVERLRRAIESAVEDRPVLFLVDEIFSGTNSRDRRIAAEAVVRALIERGGIGALSTHDSALTEIADAPGLRGANVHMGSSDAGDPLAFDYRLKPGVTTESNALAIARMAGVPV
jgi:hypothetical protein